VGAATIIVAVRTAWDTTIFADGGATRATTIFVAVGATKATIIFVYTIILVLSSLVLTNISITITFFSFTKAAIVIIIVIITVIVVVDWGTRFRHINSKHIMNCSNSLNRDMTTLNINKRRNTTACGDGSGSACFLWCYANWVVVSRFCSKGKMR